MSTTETPMSAGGDAKEPAGDTAGPAGGAPSGRFGADPSSPAGQMGDAFKRAMVAVRRLRGRETHRPGQLSFAQYGLLFGLSGACERSARELAEHADLSPATATQMLESLESAGLVTRTRSDLDRRVVLSQLTERGREVVAERHAQMQPRWAAITKQFSDEELTAAARVMGAVADYFETLLDDSVQP